MFHWKWEYLIKLNCPYLFYRISVAPSKDFRMAPFNHVMCYRKLLIKQRRSRDLTNLLITDKALDERWNHVSSDLYTILRLKKVSNF